MDYIREYKSFINSHYLNEGIRITLGLTLPAILFSYLGYLSVGITISLGASCVIMVDNAGPIHHRRNAMLICDLLIFIVALLVGFTSHFPLILGPLIFIFCFSLSMIGVYGSRASSIGLAGLFIMVLNIDGNHYGWDVLKNAFYILCGGLWYTVLSLLLYSFRPYKLTQQALGDCIQATADFLRIKASFYDQEVDDDKNYQLLLEQQVSVHEKQELVRELLFKSRDIIKDSTQLGRKLVMIFIDSVDLFERVMSIHEDYQSFHRVFSHTNILSRFHGVILEMADELHEIGIAVKSGKESVESDSLNEHIKNLKISFFELRDESRTADNVEDFINLRYILENIEDISDRLHILHSYTKYDRKISKKSLEELDYQQFVSHQEIDPKLLRSNFSLQSNIFRHSLRVAIATSVGYIVSQFFAFGHSYWILLTIIVILKPAYSLTKKRNYARLLGTIAGAATGFIILYFIKEKEVVLGFMIVFMIGAYSFMRTKYMVFVMLMTPYILLLFYLLYPHDFRAIISDRLIDTVIGSAIAFLANILIVPAWEHERFIDYVTKMIAENTNYFRDVAAAFTGRAVTATQYKLSRKHALVALANLSEAFNRMLSEPKNKQKNIRTMNQFVVLNHMFNSHVATLASFGQALTLKYQSDRYLPIIHTVVIRMKNAIRVLEQKPVQEESAIDKEQLRLLNDDLNQLIHQRKRELEQGLVETSTKTQLRELKFMIDQFNFITKTAADIEKLSYDLQKTNRENELFGGIHQQLQAGHL